MYLHRKIDSFLKDWKKNDDKMPLIIKGARQIGKTESILHFARENYSHVIYINFVTDKKYRRITENGYGTESIIKQLSFLNPEAVFLPQKTLIIFDEIQEFPEIATALKFFKMDGRFDVICSGSFLGINYRRIESNSVGYKEDYHMHSLDFEEFLWAKGYSGKNTENMLAHLCEGKAFPNLNTKYTTAFSPISAFWEVCRESWQIILKKEHSNKHCNGSSNFYRIIRKM